MRYRDILRRTGRTTKMLQEAARWALDGWTVFVVLATAQHATDAREQILTFIPDDKINTFFCNVQLPGHDLTGGGKIRFLTLGHWSIDWDLFRITGEGTNHVLLVDHFAIEVKFELILNMLHRYDPPTTSET